MSALNQLTSQIIGAAIEVHNVLGPGLLESTYEACMCREFALNDIDYERQKCLPIHYKGLELDTGYRIDLLVENQVIVELKACKSLEPIHEAQLLSYMRLSGTSIGLLINFNVLKLVDGVKRFKI